MRLPIIINVDSQFDWTKDLVEIWDAVPWETIRQKIAPSVPQSDWLFRKENRLVVVGLCSPETIDREYFERCAHHDNTEARNNNKRDEDLWKERQIGISGDRNTCSNRRLSGEEPFFRSPVYCNEGIFECYGFYTHNSSVVLEGKVDMDKVPLGVHGALGIFLCPERINEIYPVLMTRDNSLQRSIPLSANPTLKNLEIVLFHELGHHFFPVHRSGIGKYVAEAFANLFCFAALQDSLHPWLLYKTWHLQPPEYSAYRPLNLVLKEAGSNVAAVNAAFSGHIADWDALLLPERGIITRWEGISRQIEQITMAQAVDYTPALGLIRNLSSHLTVNWDNSFQAGHMHMIARRADKIPADLLWDLYKANSIYPWVLSTQLPEDMWSSWGMSTSHDQMGMDSAPPQKLSWPEGPLFRMTTRQEWERLIKESPYQWARNAAMVWLLTDLENKSDAVNFLEGFSLSDSPPTNCGAVIEAFEKYSNQFDSTVKNRIIAILQRFTEEMEANRSIRIDTEKIIEKLKGTAD